jgi:methyltransferase (TIGR00027 family)
MHEYLRARTAFFDRFVVGSLDLGVDQVVIGAAGYDGRALRYAKTGVHWFEVDLPSTQQDKLARLGRLGIGAGHVRFVEADFARDPVADRLVAAGLRPQSPALFLLVGVAVYLELDVLERALREFREVAGPDSRLAISLWVVSGAHDPEARSRFQETVAAMGEPVRSSMEFDDAIAFLARTGWRELANVPSRADGGGADEQPDADEAAAGRQRRRSVGLLVAEPAPPSRPGS